MTDLIKKGKRALTIGVAVTTIAWSIGVAALIPLSAQAATIASGDLIKASQPAVYYYGNDGKRYVFPNEKTYFTWYADFSSVKTITDAELAAISIGGNVTYKPGVKMVKITTDPKVYAVAANGSLRWIQSEAIASALYGSAWNTMVQDVSDAFFVNYTTGANVTSSADFSPATVTAAATSINSDKGLTSAAAGQLSLSLASDTPAAASVPKSAYSATFTKIILTSNGGTATITGLKVTRSNLGIDSNISQVRLLADGVQKGTAQSLNASHQAVFSLSSTPITVSAGSPVILTLAADIAAATSYDMHVLGIAAATDITTSSTVSGSFPINGNIMTIANVAIGTATIIPGPLNASDAGYIDPNAVDYRFTQINITASGEDEKVTSITAIKNGTASNTDVKEVKLVNDTSGQTLATAALDGNGRATFSNLNVTIAKGGNVNLSILGSMAGTGSGRTIGFDFHDGTSYMVTIVGQSYGYAITPTTTQGTGAVCLTGRTDYSCPRQTVNQGYLTVGKSASTPATGNIPQGGSQVALAAFDFTVAGESINVSQTVITYTTTTAERTQVTSVTLYNGSQVIAGPKDGVTTNTSAGAETLTFTDAYTLPVGTTVITVKANIATGTSAGDIVVVSMATGAITAKGGNSGKTVYTTSTGSTVPPASAITLNNMTVKAANLAISTAATPIASNLVVNAQDQIFANIDLNATAGGEDVRVSSVSVTDTPGDGATCTGINNLELWGDPDNTDATAENVRLTTSNSTTSMTDAGATCTQLFTFNTPIVVSKSATSRLTLKADVVSAADTSDTFNVAAVGDVVASGKSTGNTLAAGSKSVAGAGQAQTIQTKGLLIVTTSADMPVGAQLVSASTGNSVMKYKLSASYEPIDVTLLPIVVDISSYPTIVGNVAKVYLYVDGVKIGSTSGYDVSPTTGLLSVTLDSGTLVIPRDGYKTLEMKVDISAKDQVDPDLGNNNTVTAGTSATAGHTTGTHVDEFYFGIGAGAGGTHALWGEAAGASYYLITATGNSSGATITATTINSLGVAGTGTVSGSNAFTIHKGILTATLSATTPSGTQTAGTGKDVLKVNLTATGDDITVTDIDFTKGGTATVSGTGAAKWTSDDATINYWTFASGTAWLNAARNASASGTAVTTLTIAAGTTKVIKLNGDTTGAASTQTLQYNVAPSTLTSGVKWKDTSTNSGTAITVDLTTTKNLPVNGGGLSY